MHHLEQHVHVLEAACEEERGQRDLLQKKYTRLKRRFLLLERAHAKLIVTQAEVRKCIQACVWAKYIASNEKEGEYRHACPWSASTRHIEAPGAHRDRSSYNNLNQIDRQCT